MKYVKPELEVIKFETEDVIVTSNGGGSEIPLGPDELPIIPIN